LLGNLSVATDMKGGERKKGGDGCIKRGGRRLSTFPTDLFALTKRGGEKEERGKKGFKKRKGGKGKHFIRLLLSGETVGKKSAGLRKGRKSFS